MAKKLLKVAGILSLVFGSLVFLISYLITNTFLEVIGFIGIGYAIIKLAVGGVYLNASNKNGEEFIRKKGYVLVANIVSILTGSFITFILGIIAYIDMDKVTLAENGERYIKRELTAEEKEQKRLKNLLALGCGLVILAGVIFAVTTWETLTGVLKTFALLIFSIIFFAMSYFSENKFKLKISSITYYILSNAFLVFAFIAAGYFEILGNWFSLNGDGVNLYNSFLWILISILSYVAYIKYSQKDLFYIVDLSILISLVFLLNFFNIGNDIVLFVIISLLSIFSLLPSEGEIIKRAKNLSNILLPISLIALFADISKFNLGDRLIFNLVSFGIGFISAYYLAIHNKNAFFEIFAPIFAIATSFMLSITTGNNDKIIFLQLILISVIIYFVGYRNKEQKGLFNSSLVMCDLALLYILTDALNMGYIYFAIISGVILLGISLIISSDESVGKYHFEKIIEPLKVILLSYTLYSLFEKLEYTEETLFSAVLASIFAIICLFRKDLIKIIYFIGALVIGTFILSFNFNDIAPVTQIILVVAFCILLFITFRNEKFYKYKELTFGLTLLSIAFACLSIFNNFKLELLGIILLTIIYTVIFVCSRKNDVFRCFTITALLIPYVTILPISIWNDNINYILYSLPWLALIFVYTRGFLASVNEKTVNVIEIVTLSIWYLAVSSRLAPEVAIFIGVISFVWLLIGYKNEKWFSLYYTGIAFLIVNTIFQLKEFWTSVPLWAYILLAGLILIGIVTYKEYSKVNKENDEEKVEVEIVDEPGDNIIEKELDNRAIISGSVLYFVIIAVLVNII